MSLHRTVLYSVMFLALGVSKTLACTCLGSEPKERIERSRAVIAVEVIETKNVRVPDPSISGAWSWQQEAKLRVVRSWKGNYRHGALLVSRTYVECCACGLAVKPGEKILVFLSKTNRGTIRLSECNDRHLDRAQEELNALNGA